MTLDTTIAKANVGFLEGTADRIDRILKDEDAERISTEDMINEFAMIRDGIRAHVHAQPSTDQDFALLLKDKFPWLGTDDEAGSGADVIGELGELYESLTADAPRQFWHLKLKGRDYYLIQNTGSRCASVEFYRSSKGRGWKLREPEIAIGAPVVDANVIAPVDLPQDIKTICLDYGILTAEEMR